MASFLIRGAACPRKRFETFETDGLAALFAKPVRPGFHLPQRAIDLRHDRAGDGTLPQRGLLLDHPLRDITFLDRVVGDATHRVALFALVCEESAALPLELAAQASHVSGV